jgi:hypothetical protein
LIASWKSRRGHFREVLKLGQFANRYYGAGAFHAIGCCHHVRRYSRQRRDKWAAADWDFLLPQLAEPMVFLFLIFFVGFALWSLGRDEMDRKRRRG